MVSHPGQTCCSISELCWHGHWQWSEARLGRLRTTNILIIGLPPGHHHQQHQRHIQPLLLPS
eukprot:5155542-Prorocentrum_lima.AAC.1